VIDREAVSWTLWAYVGCTVMNLGFFMARSLSSKSVHHPVGIIVTSVAVVIFWDYFLLRGVRWLWIATIVVLAGGLLLDIATETILWWALVITVTQIVLLLLPTTRRFFERREARA
jgi:hypothetical protein